MPSAQRLKKTIWVILIVAVATIAGMTCAWRAPGLNRYAQDLMMRARGRLPVPDEIVIVAIDEPSIRQLGQFPWERDLTARVLDLVSAGKPKVITLDILYAESTETEDDEALADAIKRAGNVAISEQLIEEQTAVESGHSTWLRSLPEIKSAAAGVGHVNVGTEQDGAAHDMLLRLSDDEGDSRWALAVETIRVGDNLNPDEIRETNNIVYIGTRELPFSAQEHNLSLKLKDSISDLTVIEPRRMTIDYIGPTGSFAANTYSFADVLENRIAPGKFRNKYVLIGATAATLGDRIATPFVHSESSDGDQNGDLMPGVEILANSVNTILRGRFYQSVSDWIAGLLAAIVAIAVIFLTRLAEGRFEAAKQLVAFSGLGVFILLGCYFVFFYFLIIPPIVPMIVSFATAAPLALLNRSLVASAGIDERIGELLAVEKSLLSNVSYQAVTHSSENYLQSKNIQINHQRGKFFPRSLEWKTQTLRFLTGNLIARSLFVDRALRSLEEGLLIAEPNGLITFANRRAGEILDLPEKRIMGSNLFLRLRGAEKKPENALNFSEQTILQTLIDQTSIKREMVIGEDEESHYILRLSAVIPHGDDDNQILGIVATLSDITHYHELQQVRNEVIMLVTHELRTPLTAIQGMSELLTEHDVLPEARLRMLATINAESKRLGRMINEYLDLTRLESRIQKAHFNNVNPTDLLDQTLLLLEPLAAQREIKIVRCFETTQTIVSGDPGMLVQALTNIVANAIKYSPKKTKITVSTETEGESLKISVKDEGYGISKEQLPRIFEKFYRIPRRQTEDASGTGLGLALTQQIIELHDGKITVESEPDSGSTFTVYLPLAPER